jgi:hypothetical protein
MTAPRRAPAARRSAPAAAPGASAGAPLSSGERSWTAGHERLAEVRFDGSLVHVRHVRDFDYRTADDPTPRWLDRTYDLRRLERAWLVISPFDARWRGPAHAFVSFGFADGSHVSVSVEARRAAGEAYSVWRGLLRRFVTIFVVAEERDAIGLRAVVLGKAVHLYPIRAEAARIRGVFAGMLRRAEEVRRRPEFYHTITNNCATSILAAVNALAPRRIPYGPRVLLPGYLDGVAFGRGLIDTELSLAEAREAFRVDARARAAYVGGADFSRAIRGWPAAPAPLPPADDP